MTSIKSDDPSSVRSSSGGAAFFKKRGGEGSFFSRTNGSSFFSPVIQRSEIDDPYALENGLIQPRLETGITTDKISTVNRKMIQLVRWTSNTDTGRDSRPWGAGSPNGDVLSSSTDAGTAINIWRPHDGVTYWCHGYTFGGSGARGGPFSTWGQYVPQILQDEGWQPTYSCMAEPRDILIFYDDQNRVLHSGIIRNVVSSSGIVDEGRSTLESKWGYSSHNTKSWLENARQYGGYKAYSKQPLQGACSNGANEII
jgi:hypothetical protein